MKSEVPFLCRNAWELELQERNGLFRRSNCRSMGRSVFTPKRLLERGPSLNVAELDGPSLRPTRRRSSTRPAPPSGHTPGIV